MDSPRLIGDRYELGDVIGQGGMGLVYRAHDRETGEAVAVKALRADLIQHQPQLVERFAREGEVLRQLNHPNIVNLLEAIREDDWHYLVMEFVSGGSLQEWLEQNGRMPVEQVLGIALELADALTRAHHLKIIHRDIKPANVLLAGDGTPRLSDFGIAYRSEQQRVTQDNQIVGTLVYLSPEAFRENEVDGRADIWAFGVMLFEMLVGERPFGTMLAILTHPTPHLETLSPDAPIALVDLIYRMLQKDRDSRIPSIRQVGVELEAITRGYDMLGSTSFEALRFNTPPPTEKPGHNLPAQTTPFLGREAELAQLKRLLRDPSVRLITITGPGGMGKTRLALEVAAHLLGIRGEVSTQTVLFPGGVYFVALAPVTDPARIVSRLADAVGFQFYSSGDPKEQLLDYLRGKRLLLVIDNFEHLLDGASLLSEILQIAPDVQILSTSRERLHLQEETIFRIEGMDFPEWDTLEDALEYSAVKLFMQSAHRVRPDFELQADDLYCIARICRAVQGMPLGILLAAAWIEALSLPEIAEEISQALDFLETDIQNVPERHRSIRAVLDYSWNLLGEAERDVFSCLSVFQGGFTRDAAQKVAGANLRQLTAFASKSLLRRTPGGRYFVHELLRQYADERLQQRPGAVAEVRDAHCAYYADFLHERLDDLLRDNQLQATQMIEAEFENVRGCWRWAVSHSRVEAIHKAIDPIALYCHYRSRYVQAVAALADAVPSLHNTLPEAGESLPLAEIMLQLGWFYIRLGRIEQAQDTLEQAHEIFARLDLPGTSGLGNDTMCGLSLCASILGDFEEAEKIGAEARQQSEARGIKETLMFSFYVLVSASMGQGKYEEALYYAQQSYALSQELHNRWFSAICLNDLGSVARVLGHYAEAIEHYRASYAIRASFDDAGGMGTALNHQGRIALLQGDTEEADRVFQQSLTLYRNRGDRGGLATALSGLGQVALVQGDYPAAGQLFREALDSAGTQIVQLALAILNGIGELLLETGRAERGIALLSLARHHSAADRETQEQAEHLLTHYEATLGHEDYVAAVEQGQALDLEAEVKRLLAESP